MSTATDTFADFVDHLTEALDDPTHGGVGGRSWAAGSTSRGSTSTG